MRMAPGRAAPRSVQHLADYYNSVYLQERLQQNLVKLKQGYSSSAREDLCSTGSVRFKFTIFMEVNMEAVDTLNFLCKRSYTLQLFFDTMQRSIHLLVLVSISENS